MPNEFVAGSNRISVDILNLSDEAVGPGPLMSCLDLNYDALLNQAGSYSARFPANDPRLAYLQLKKHTLQFYYDGAAIFQGMVDSWEYQLDNKGEQILVVTGRDMLGELAEIPVRNFNLEDSAEPTFNAIEQIMLIGTLPAGWGMSGLLTTETGVYASLAGEPVLSALTRIAEHIGESFRLQPNRDLHWIGAGLEASGVRAIQTAGDAIAAENNHLICFIQRLTERRDATRMITTIYPEASGLGETQLNLEGTSRVAPAGFTLDDVENSLTSDAALAYMGGQVRGRRVGFKDIRPLGNTDTDVLSAKDYLFDTALAYLQRNDDVNDVVEYDLDVLKLPAHVQVGMTIRVVFQDALRNIDLDLFILGIRRTIGSDGATSYSLTVAPVNQWRIKETDKLTAQIEEGEIFAAHPQIDASTYWMTFREEIGDDQTDHIAEFPFYLGAEVQTIRQVLLRCRVDRLLSAVGVVTYADPNTALGGATSTGATAAGTTNTDGGAISGATAAGSSDNGGSGTSTATAAGVTDTDGSGTSGATAAGTTNTDGTGTTSDTAVTVSTTGTTDVGTTVAYTFVTASDSSGTGEGGTIVTGGSLSANPATHTHDITSHQHKHSHDHAIVTEHGHSSANHNHSTPNHSHLLAATHTHTTPNHNHTLNNTHTHGTPAHAHTTSATHTHTTPAHAHVMSATHLHSMAQHTHAAPALVTTYGLRLTPAPNSYVLADLEYRVNGGDWALLSTGVPIEDGYSLLDLTIDVQNPAGLKRPYQSYNKVQIRRTTAAGAGKTCMVRAQLGIRQTVQSIVSYS